MEYKKNKLPVVSICIPLYNASEYIEETLTRALQQSYKYIEVVVVDDHSTDESYDIAKRFECEKIKVFKNPKKGGNAARNFAFQQSQGDYIKFMDADDYCSENMIEEQLKRFLADGTEKTLVFSPVRLLHLEGPFDPPRAIDKDYIPGIGLLIDIWQRKGFHCPHCHLISRSLVEASGGWNEEILKNQDGEYFARIAAMADKALSVPNAVAVWRQTKKGVSVQANKAAMDSCLDTLDIISNLLISYDDSPIIKEICGSYIGFFVFENYPKLKESLSKLEVLLSKNKIPFIVPNRRILKFLSFCFGWRTAYMVVHKLNMSNVPK